MSYAFAFMKFSLGSHALMRAFSDAFEPARIPVSKSGHARQRARSVSATSAPATKAPSKMKDGKKRHESDR